MNLLEKVLDKRNINIDDLEPKREDKLVFPELDKAVQDTFKEFFMQETPERIEERMNVGVFYDVDVDGLYAGHIMEDFLNRFNKWNIKRHMNKNKAHGITKETIKWVLDEDIKWLFVVDAGSMNAKEVSYLVSKGVKVVILDHHPFVEEELPEGAWLVNISKYKDLPQISGCGVTYRYIEQIAETFDLEVKQYEVFVGITTISDMVNVRDNENRYYMKRAYEGRESTLLFRKFDFWGSNLSFYGWQVVPYLNAIIRVGFEKRALDVVNNMDSVRKMQRISNDVKRIKGIQEDKKTILFENSKIKVNDHVVLCLRKGKDDLTSLNGLVGNKLVSEYGKSALVLYFDNDLKIWKGSFRGHQFDSTDLNNWNFKTMGHLQACGVEVTHQDLLKFFKEAKFGELEKKKADIYVDESEVSTQDFIDIAVFNEFTGVGLPKILVGFKKGMATVTDINNYNMKRQILVTDKFEIIDFSGKEHIIYGEDEYEDLIVTPTLSRDGYQLIKE